MSGHIGVCKCRNCGFHNSWRSDFVYQVKDPSKGFQSRAAISPGFLGACCNCSKRDPQDVVEITSSLGEADARCEEINGGLTVVTGE